MFSKLLAVAGLCTLGVGFYPDASHGQMSEVQLEKEIKAEIQRRHRRDDPEWWRSRAPKAPIVAIRLFYEMPQTKYQMALLKALSWFDTPEVEEFLKDQATHSSKRLLKDAAIETIGYAQGIKAKDFIKDFLNDKHPRTRFAAAQALTRMAQANEDEDLNRTIASYRAAEKESWIIAKLDGQKTPKNAKEPRDLFLGEWSGYWLLPQKNGSGLDSFPAKIRITGSKSDRRVLIEYGLMNKDKFEKKAEFLLQDLRFLDTGFKGKVAYTADSPQIFNRSSHSGPMNVSDQASYAASVEAELVRSVNGNQIRLSIPKWEAFIVVRRSP